MRKPIILSVLISLATSNAAMAQTGLLLIQPSVRANGMGGASVASAVNDALAISFNPAHIGGNHSKLHFTTEFYSEKTVWLPSLVGFSYDAKSFMLGYDLRKSGNGIPLRIGAGYTRIFLDFGKQIITGETGQVVNSFESWDRANIFTIGIGIDYTVKAGFGWSFKNVKSNLAPGAEDNVMAHDFGILVHLPVFDFVSQWKNKSFEFAPGIRPYFLAGFGYTLANLGGKITYIDVAQADPLPRTARMGVNFNGGFLLSRDHLAWRLFSFERLLEAEDLLVTRDFSGESSYKGLLGDINIWDNIFRGKAEPGIITQKGWEFNFFEVFSFRSGRHEDPLGRVVYTTEGTGVSISGIFKALFYLEPNLRNDSVLGLIGRHLDVQFNSSKFKIGEGHPLRGTKFQSIRIQIRRKYPP